MLGVLCDPSDLGKHTHVGNRSGNHGCGGRTAGFIVGSATLAKDLREGTENNEGLMSVRLQGAAVLGDMGNWRGSWVLTLS